MRSLALILFAMPFAALADDIPLTSQVTAVTLFPQGATVTRNVPFDMPAGQHRLILRDLPRSTPLEQVRVEVTGATLGGVTARRDDVPPRDAPERPDIAEARDELERHEVALREAQGAVEAIRLEAEAAQARVRFLDRLGDNDGAAQMDVGALRALTEMIGDETLQALQQAQAATRRAEESSRDLAPLIEARDSAEQALNALLTEEQTRASLAVEVTSDTAAQGTLTITYVTPAASWTPVYDLRLVRDTGALTVARGAFVAQSTGEDWRDVAVTLSTVRPAGQMAPSVLSPRGLRIYEEDKMPRPLTLQRRSGLEMADAAAAAPMAEEVRVTTAAAAFDGIAVTYTYPAAVTIATGADRVRLALGTLDLATDLRARAVPFYDDTAYLVAEITNDTGELILPSDEASFYLDGRYIGQRYLDLIPSGATAALSFGPVDGLQVTRVVLDRSGGDRGVISRSNALEETVRITVENLTQSTWPLVVIDRVPFTEQEDLEIDWRATPAPAEQNIDDQRGILAWRFDLAPGATQEIRLSKTITWPDGWVLQ
ncbi:DUF4139 domain-containing protein [Roseovarius aestuariivivens]|uniref:DUF4139 domain-containing protein n=1 Tax=Roseovarius aestuariivivens TaxID=1888910 RepID=UPI0010812965|nr:DUF4139 domain-containing protein [Roseovarius aestuariivivens]